jgi:hypothetical protein
MTRTPDANDAHAEAIVLIPWLVNGRLPPGDAAWLERHVQQCEICRREVAAEQGLRQAVRHDGSNVEHAPHAALQKLWARIDQSTAAAPVTVPAAETRPAVSTPATRESVGLQATRWKVAAAAILAIGVGFVAVHAVGRFVPGFDPDYRTATAGRPTPGGVGQIRAVFSPSVTVDELSQIVGSSRLKIVDGPSDAGVYTLALQSGQAMRMADVIARLRSDPRVRFAEPIADDSGTSP